MLLYAHTISSRLQYILQWFQEHYLTESIELTDSVEQFRSYPGPRINYSTQRITDQECWIEPSPLLFEKSIQHLAINVCTNGTYPFFMAGRGDMGFDLFGASFYLITRYEEYLPHQQDPYGRYAAEQSIAFRHTFLQRPLVDEWMKHFCLLLRTYFPALIFKENHFQVQITYDIDESFAFKYKSAWMQSAGSIRDLFSGRMDWITERLRTILGRQKDPYDSYAFLEQLHQTIGIRPICFLHVAEKKGAFDKNLSPKHPAQQELIRSIHSWSEIGLHPSWQSGNRSSLLIEEKKTLEGILNESIYRSRQHYIRFALPVTYRSLIDLGITDDYSMGYGSMNGFRASTTRSFSWFDLSRNEITSLRIHPFCYMDANSFYELGHSIDQAEKEWKQLEASVRSVNGQMITVWHNTFLGTQHRFAGWRERYEQWLMTHRS